MTGQFFIAAALFFFAGIFSVASAQDYVVGDGDLLRITVYDHPDLTTVTRVGGEGTVLFPLIGQVRVAGLSVSQVSRRVAQLLSEGYIVSPQVTVFIEEFRSQKALIMGQVNRPGMYELKGHTTLLEILSKAGDLTRDAGDKVIIKRKAESPEKKEKVITIDLKRLIEGGDTSQDVPVIDGDSIYIVKASVFFVTGEVKKPDMYKLEEGTTVLKAITMAGGFSDKASTGRIKIIRKAGGKDEVLERVKLDEPVLSDDVIVVPESFF
ncbi:MAG: SLBB domain-containing protein [Nitrospirae bacterium]|nr:SLBB domain-containing protein [Nitrospirota bacterium]